MLLSTRYLFPLIKRGSALHGLRASALHGRSFRAFPRFSAAGRQLCAPLAANPHPLTRPFLPERLARRPFCAPASSATRTQPPADPETAHPSSEDGHRTQSERKLTTPTTNGSGSDGSGSKASPGAGVGVDPAMAASQAPGLERKSSSKPEVDSPEHQKLEKDKKTKTRKEMKEAGELSRWKYVNPIFILKKVWKFTSAVLQFLATPSSWGPKTKVAWSHFKDEMKHYWKGTKLLWADIKVVSRLGRKILKGNSLTWREREHLKRTLADCLRLIPFSFFILIPALEILLPVAIFLFPGMLPSTFEKKAVKEKKQKARLQLQAKVAGFFQEFLNEQIRMIKTRDSADPGFVAGIEKIVGQMRDGTPIRTETTLKIARMFDDHITIDNFETNQLDQLCKFIGIGTWGRSDAWKRRALGKFMQRLKTDDKYMRADLANMTIAECNKALRDRGMRGDDDVDFARDRLRGWLRLSLDEKVPLTLLMLSRTFNIRLDRERWRKTSLGGLEPKDAQAESKAVLETLQTVISKELPKTSVDQMLVEKAGVKNMEVEVEVIKRQDKIIEEEMDLATKELEPSEVVEKNSEEVPSTEETEEDLEASRRAKRDELAVQEAVKQAKQSNEEAQKQLKEIEEKEEMVEDTATEPTPKQAEKPSPKPTPRTAAEKPDPVLLVDEAEEIGKDEELYQLQAEVIENWAAQTKANRLSKQVLKMMQKIENDIKKSAEAGKDADFSHESLADTDPSELAERVESIYNKDPEKWKEVEVPSEGELRRTSEPDLRRTTSKNGARTSRRPT